MYKSTSASLGTWNKNTGYQPIKVILNKSRARMPISAPNLANINLLSLGARKGLGEDEVGKITTFEVGITIQPPKGVILHLVGTQALVSHGYMIPNGIAFVQPNTPLTVQLYKFREGPDLELPYEGSYLISQRLNSFIFKRIEKPRSENHKSLEFNQEISSSSINDFPPPSLNTLT